MRLKLIAFSFLLLAISCSKNKEPNKICFTRTLNELKIKNNTSKTVYFAAFGESILPLIDWAPGCVNNGMPANSSVNKKLSEIPGYSNEEKLVVYWWECTANKPGEIHSLLLNKYQEECQ